MVREFLTKAKEKHAIDRRASTDATKCRFEEINLEFFRVFLHKTQDKMKTSFSIRIAFFFILSFLAVPCHKRHGRSLHYDVFKSGKVYGSMSG